MLIKDIEKMEAYTPTEYVNDSEPDLDADNLNKTERQLRDTVAKANEIIDTLKSLISNVSVNSEDTVPSSAVAYKMEQDIEQLNSNIAFEKTLDTSTLTIDENIATLNGNWMRLGHQVTVYMILNVGLNGIQKTQAFSKEIPVEFLPIHGAGFLLFNNANENKTFCAYVEQKGIRATEQVATPGTWYASASWSVR